MAEGTMTADLPLSDTIAELLGNANDGAGTNTVRILIEKLSAQLAASGPLATKIAGAADGLVEVNTWPQLNAIPGTRAGQPGQAIGPDAGTHTDPVVGGAVPNKGKYTWSTAPAGWRWIADYQAVTEETIEEVYDAMALRAPLNSPAFTGVPTLPTAAPGTNTTQAATTAFVQAAISVLLGGAPPAALDTLNELAAALGNDGNFAATIANALALKAPLNNAALTGTPTAPTAAPGTNTAQIATTAFIKAAIDVLQAAVTDALALKASTAALAAEQAAREEADTALNNVITAESTARAGLIAAVDTLDGNLAGMTRAKDATGTEQMLSRIKGDGTHVVEALELPNRARLMSLETLDGELHSMVTARGSTGAEHIVDAYGRDGYRPPWFQAEPPDEGFNTLRMTGTRMGQILAAAGSPVAINAQLVIDIHGTSISWNPIWYTGILKRRLDTLLGDGGYGWIDLTNGSEASTPQLLSGPCIRFGAVTAVLTGAWVPFVATQPATNGGFQQSSTVGNKITINAPGSYAGPDLSSAKLHAVGTADGEVRYRWNGGSWSTLSVAGAGLLIATLAGHPAGPSWTLEIEVTAGTVKIAGVDLRSAANGVIINKLAMNGATIAQLASIDEATWIAAKQALAADLTIIGYSTNDQMTRTEAQFEGNLNTVVSRTLAARPYSDILIITEAENVRLSPNRMQIYARAARRVARAYDVGYIDMTAFMKGSAKANGYSGRKFYDYAGDGVDVVHPSTTIGAPKMADVIYRYLTR